MLAHLTFIGHATGSLPLGLVDALKNWPFVQIQVERLPQAGVSLLLDSFFDAVQLVDVC